MQCVECNEYKGLPLMHSSKVYLIIGEQFMSITLLYLL